MPAYIPKAARQDWRTPPEVVELVREALGGEIQLDPCASRKAANEELIGALNLYGPPSGDGLALPWGGRTAYVNPPFKENAAWMMKCCVEAQKGAEVIALIPARTDTRYWQDVIAKTASAICFWKGRMKFVGAPASAPFPVALVYWGEHAERFCGVFQAHGQTVPFHYPEAA